jgi:hypothetical protein
MLSGTDIHAPRGATVNEPEGVSHGGDELFVVTAVAAVGLVRTLIAAAFTLDWSQPIAFLGLE